MANRSVFPLTGSSSASASTSTIVATFGGSLLSYDWFTIDGTFAGATGGACDWHIQRKVTTDVWADWLHFPQIAAGATKRYSVMSGSDKTIHEVTHGTDASHGTPALAANTFVGGHPGQTVRLVAVTGSGVSVASAATVYLTCWQGTK